MKNLFIKQAVVFIITLFVFGHAFAQVNNNNSLSVIIIRHGEKPEAGENLSCQGFNRARQLADVLYAKFKIPDYIFVPSIKTGKSTSEARMYQTIVPFAVKHNLNIDTKYAVDDVAGLAKSILKKNGRVLLVWEHKNIPDIAQALGVQTINLKWNSDDFDSIWIITFKNGNATLHIDKENLHPAATCN